MAALIRRLYREYQYINEELSDPRTQDLMFIGTPWWLFGIIAFYLYFIFGMGPKLMKNRKPFEMRRIIQIYNLVQIVVCSFVCYKGLTLAWLFDYEFICQPVDFSMDPRPQEIAWMVWFYFMVKVMDLLDTVFFILRKKDHQVSFLHVYHHGGMVIGCWIITKFLPGGHVTFLGLVNSFVHVIMYSHYLITSFNIWKPWWKKYVTQLQLSQFVLLFVQYVMMILKEDCKFPKWVGALFIPQNLFMIILFGEFYYKVYIKKPKAKVSQNGFPAEATNGKLKSQ